MPKKEKWTVIDVDVEPLKKVSKPDVEVEDARDAAKSRGESLMELFKQLVGEEKAVKVPTEYVPTDVPTFYEQLAEKLPEPTSKAKPEEGPGKPHQAVDPEAAKMDTLRRMLETISKSDLPKDVAKRKELEELLLRSKGQK
jgi:hypothetical protein